MPGTRDPGGSPSPRDHAGTTSGRSGLSLTELSPARLSLTKLSPAQPSLT
jgi:hypothetical protein